MFVLFAHSWYSLIYPIFCSGNFLIRSMSLIKWEWASCIISLADTMTKLIMFINIKDRKTRPIRICCCTNMIYILFIQLWDYHLKFYQMIKIITDVFGLYYNLMLYVCIHNKTNEDQMMNDDLVSFLSYLHRHVCLEISLNAILFIILQIFWF